MAKTNKEIRDDLAHKYYDSLREVEGTLEFLAKSWYSKEEIKETRERLISNLQNNLSNEEWYEESKKSHIAEHKAKWLVSKAKEEKERLKREYEEKMLEADRDIVEKEEAYKAAQIDYRWKIEEETEVKDKKEELYWDKEKILESLKQKVEVEENVEYMWYKWKKVHITLPREWEFEWFKFEYFVSDESVHKKDFESNVELEKKSYSMKEVWNLLKAMNRYMKAMGVETDWNMDYENDLKYRTYNYGCAAWDCLKQIAWLNSLYWLKDKNVDWTKNLRGSWSCYNFNCDFCRLGHDFNDADLFLRLSD